MSDPAPYTPRELAVRMADEWLESHRKSETWRIVDMLRDEIVRGAAHDAQVRRDAAREALDGLAERHAQTASILTADSQARFYEEKIALRIARYRDTNYPEDVTP